VPQTHMQLKPHACMDVKAMLMHKHNTK